MAEKKQDDAATYGKVVARAWRDPAFKAKLLADPHAALKDAGVAVPAGISLTVVENTDTHVHLVLPPKPTRELSDEALDRVVAGEDYAGPVQYIDTHCHIAYRPLKVVLKGPNDIEERHQDMEINGSHTASFAHR